MDPDGMKPQAIPEQSDPYGVLNNPTRNTRADKGGLLDMEAAARERVNFEHFLKGWTELLGSVFRSRFGNSNLSLANPSGISNFSNWAERGLGISTSNLLERENKIVPEDFTKTSFQYLSVKRRLVTVIFERNMQTDEENFRLTGSISFYEKLKNKGWTIDDWDSKSKAVLTVTSGQKDEDYAGNEPFADRYTDSKTAVYGAMGTLRVPYTTPFHLPNGKEIIFFGTYFYSFQTNIITDNPHKRNTLTVEFKLVAKEFRLWH